MAWRQLKATRGLLKWLTYLALNLWIHCISIRWRQCKWKNITKCEFEDNENKKKEKRGTFDSYVWSAHRWFKAMTFLVFLHYHIRCELTRSSTHGCYTSKYIWSVPLQRGPLWYDIAYITAMTVKEQKSKFQLPITHNRHPIDQSHRCGHPQRLVVNQWEVMTRLLVIRYTKI